jgi:hypothetical protein
MTAAEALRVIGNRAADDWDFEAVEAVDTLRDLLKSHGLINAEPVPSDVEVAASDAVNKIATYTLLKTNTHGFKWDKERIAAASALLDVVRAVLAEAA